MKRSRPSALPGSDQRWTAVDAQQILEACDRSGLSAAEFAQQRGLDPRRLYWWRRRLAELAIRPPQAFAEVALPRSVGSASAMASADAIEIVLRSGHIIRASRSLDVDALARLVRALDIGSGGC